MTRRRALHVAAIAHRHGVGRTTALIIALAARARGVGFALAFALVEQESGFRHIFGHDPGGPFQGEKVTRELYRKLQNYVRGGGTSNGVGLTQITYPGYIETQDGLWRRRRNVRFGLGLISGFIRAYGDEREALAVYNGGPSNPQWGYADEVLARRAKWRQRFDG